MEIPASDTRWIWCEGEERPKNFYLHVRKSFNLMAGVRNATIRLTADSRYRLFVNGVAVARGPARCDRRRQCVDQWDIGPLLRPGLNVVAALVHHYGEWTFSYMLGRGGFLAEVEITLADGTIRHLPTDNTWKVKPAEAWERHLPRMSIQTGYPEVYDARKEFSGWTEPEYDDAGWAPATLLGPPGMEPWPNFVLREIPGMTEIPTKPERLMESGEVGRARTGHYVDLLRVVWSMKNGVAYLATFVWSPADVEAELHAGSQESIRLWVNGKVVVDHLVTRDPAPDQEVVSVSLRKGWNPVLAKIVQGEGQWHFYFRLETDPEIRLAYGRLPEGDPHEADPVEPWWFIGPFESAGLQHGFQTIFPPEVDIDFTVAYPAADGRELRWISAGVTQESMLTSVVMSREVRMPARGRRIDHPEGLIEHGTPALVHPGAGEGAYVVIDFGRELAGYPVIEIDRALGGEIIDCGYAEILQTPGGEVVRPTSGSNGIVNPDRAGVHYADRYVCRSGKQRFQTFDKRAFRYLQLDFRNLRGPIEVGPVSLLLSTYPVAYAGSFDCSDPLLNRIWEVGRWTVQLNMEDAYTDCPWRERGQWWGDARIEALINYYCFGDLHLIRNGLRQIASSQRDDGLTWGIYPTDWTYGILPTFTLLWIISLKDYYDFSGDRTLVAELFPAVERALSFFTSCIGDHGLLRDLPFWVFVDWERVETAGESASVNALYHGALLAAAELASVAGPTVRSEDYAVQAREIRSAMRRILWDADKHCFRDAWREGGLTQKISEQANCWAICFGAAFGREAGEIITALADDDRPDVRTGSPYFAFYLLQALALTGQHRKMLDIIRNRWGAMLEWGATTWWETWEPKASFCHGWSAGPTYFLQSEILGVKPGTPGWQSIAIHPHPSGLSRAHGNVPTPLGTVSVDWTLESDFTLDLTLPAPGLAVVPLCALRTVTVSGRDGTLFDETTGNFGDATEVEITLPHSGSYRIRST